MTDDKKQILREIQELTEQIEVDEDLFLGDSVIYMKMARSVKNPEVAFLIDAQARIMRKQTKKEMQEIKLKLDTIPKMASDITNIKKLVQELKQEYEESEA